MTSVFVENRAAIGSFGSKQDKYNKSLVLILVAIFFCHIAYSQQKTYNKYRLASQLIGISSELKINSDQNFQHGFDSSKPSKNRVWTVAAINVVGYGASLIILNNTWYKNYPHTSFHTFDDSKEWLQVDKVGHAWTAYNTGRVSAAMWRWAGLPAKKSAVIGGLSGAAYLTAIEFLDAHSSKWGWSWSDIAANFFGAGLFISQELAWSEQRLQIKFSFHKKSYSDPALEQRADDLFGANWNERMLKDYNAQTYWLSANLKSFFKKTNLPAWLNLSFGYGADGMYGGFENKWIESTSIDRSDIPRCRQFYFAPDVDLTKIKTNSKFIRSTLFILNAFKFPMPTIEYTTGGKWKLYALYF